VTALDEAIEILKLVAPDQPMNQDEQGGCVWCAGTPIGNTYGYATDNPNNHTTDCPWILARQFLKRMEIKRN